MASSSWRPLLWGGQCRKAKLGNDGLSAGVEASRIDFCQRFEIAADVGLHAGYLFCDHDPCSFAAQKTCSNMLRAWMTVSRFVPMGHVLFLFHSSSFLPSNEMPQSGQKSFGNGHTMKRFTALSISAALCSASSVLMRATFSHPPSVRHCWGSRPRCRSTASASSHSRFQPISKPFMSSLLRSCAR